MKFNFLGLIKTILFPSRCIICDNICSNFLCKRCENSLENEFNSTIVSTSHKNVVCVSPFIYEGKVKKIIHNYKFKHQKNLFKILIPFLCASIQEKFKDEKFDLITSVPLHVSSLNERGYNQSELLGIELSKVLGIPYEECIIKTKKNKTQHGLSFCERQTNVKGVYKAIKNYENKNILICDDIITTGATLSECVKQLSGAKVLCATVAYTVKGVK